MDFDCCVLGDTYANPSDPLLPGLPLLVSLSMASGRASLIVLKLYTFSPGMEIDRTIGMGELELSVLLTEGWTGAPDEGRNIEFIWVGKTFGNLAMKTAKVYHLKFVRGIIGQPSIGLGTEMTCSLQRQKLLGLD